MVIEIEDRFLEEVGITKTDILLRIAIEFFKEERLSLGKASRLAGLHQFQFQKELAKRKIPIHYDVEDFEMDMQTLERLKHKECNYLAPKIIDNQILEV